ncbi:MAG TPA: hypothetical protein PK548_07175 [Bacteroidales bacterium]|nr:hypothetical protein [Bacteroidales bacterium]
MLTLQCEIKIKSKSTNKIVLFDYVNSIEVKTSCKNLTDTAVVKIPRKMSWKGKEIYNYLRRDDAITIRIGYKEHGLETVFKGYIKSVENGTPIVINCENEMRLFKTITVKPEKIKNFNIKSFLKKYVPNIEVVCPNSIDFGTVVIQEQSLAQCLDKLMSTFTWFKGFFRDGKFVAIIDTASLRDNKTITFDPERNLISDTLKYELAEDVKIAIKAVSILKDNTKLECIVPSDAKDGKDYEQRQFYFPGYTDAGKLKEAAGKKLKEFVSDKMTGSITGFGVPFVQKNDVVRLKDSRRAERDGKFFWVESVDYTFNTSGYRQKITLGYELKRG